MATERLRYRIAEFLGMWLVLWLALLAIFMPSLYLLGALKQPWGTLGFAGIITGLISCAGASHALLD